MPNDAKLYGADAEAVLEEAPDYETGIKLLQEYYGANEWDNQKAAESILQQSEQKLSKKYNQPLVYDFETTKQVVPLELGEVSGDPEERLSRINDWEKQNADLLNNSDDIDIVTGRQKLLTSLKRAAISERRLLNDKDTLDSFEARQEKIVENETPFHALGRKALGGVIGGITDLLGFDEISEALSAEDPKTSFAENAAGDLAMGVGFMGGLGASAGVGAAVGSVVPVLGTAVGAAVGGGAYILANAGGAIRRQFEASEEATGDLERATGAAAIEGTSQIIQAAIGGKAVVGLGKRIIGRTLGTVGAEVATGAAVGAGTGALGGGLSATASQVGADNYSVEGILEGAGRGALAGVTLGTVVSGAGVGIGLLKGPPPDTHKTNLNTIPTNRDLSGNIPAENGNTITTTPDGKAVQGSPQQGEVSVPYDGSFAVTEEKARKIQALKDGVDPEGEKVAIYVNEDGKLVTNNKYVAEDGTLSETPVNQGEVELAVFHSKEGNFLVEANKPRATESQGVEYASRVSAKSAGAASITDLGYKEMKRGQRVRETEAVRDRVREEFGGPEGPGLFRYLESTNLDRTNTADAQIAEQGFDGAVADFLSQDPHTADDQHTFLGTRLEEHLNKAAHEADKAGDTIAADKLDNLASEVSQVLTFKSHKYGKGLQAFTGQRGFLTKTLSEVRESARNKAREEVALEEGVSLKDIDDTPIQLEQTKTQMDEISKVEHPEVVALDKDITDTESLIKEIDTTAEEALTKANEVDEGQIAKAQNEIETLTERNKEKPSEKRQKRIEDLQGFVKDKQQEIKSRTADDVQGVRITKKREKLSEGLQKLKTKRDETHSKLSESFKVKYDELKKKFDKLSERKAKVDRKVKERVEERLPQSKREELTKLQKAADLLPDNSIHKEIVKAKADLIRHEAAGTYVGKMKSFVDRLNTYYHAQMLFRASTQAGNIAFNTGKLLLNAAAYSLPLSKGSRPIDGIKYLIDFTRAARESGFNEGGRVFLEGKGQTKTRLKNQKYKASELEVAEGRTEVGDFGDAVTTIKGEGGLISTPLSVLGYALRGLEAADAVFTRGGYEAEAALIARKEGRRLGKRGEDLRTHLAEKLFNSKSDWEGFLKQSEERAKILRDAGIETSERDVVSHAWAMMDQQRNKDLRAESAYGAGVSWLNQDVAPRGVTAFFLNKVSEAFSAPIQLPNGKIIPNPAGIIQPFLRTVLKAANLTIDATPIGFGKALSGKLIGESKNVVHAQLGSAIIGTSLMGITYGILKAQRDDPNPWFDLIGPVPSDPGDRAVFQGAKKKPWSIKLGDTYIGFAYTPLIGPLGSIAMLNHNAKYQKDFKEKDGYDVAGMMLFGSFAAFKDLSLLQTSAGLLEAITKGEDTKDTFTNQLTGMARNVIPGITVSEELMRAFGNPISTRNSWQAKILRGTPFASMVGNPTLNAWGEPIEKDWYEKLPIAGSLSGRFVNMQTDDPNFLWLTNNRYSITGIENKIKISDEAGKWKGVKEARKRNFGAIYDDVLTESEQYELQKRVGPMYKSIVNTYRLRYGNHGFIEQVQDNLKKELSDAKSKVKYELFVQGAFPKKP